MAAVMVAVAQGFVNVLLVGPRSETRPLADRYAAFYNVPLLERDVGLFPSRFVMILDEPVAALVSEGVLVRVEDYPHRGKADPNYFISWVKQISGGS